jgi:hypothetical protein
MTRAELLALAARVEAAQGADRMIDSEIHITLGRPVRECAGEDGCLFQQLASVPHYTVSLDAAASLVPEGWAYHIAMRPWFDLYQAEGSVWAFGQRAASFTGAASTPALALTAAAIRALAEEARDEQ